MKIAIITMHAARNYGAVLQTYALQKYLEMQGHDSVILDYKLPNQTTKGYLLNINSKFQKNAATKAAYLAKTIVPKCLTTKLFSNFQKQYLHLSDPITFTDGAFQGLPEADVYCVGSDQIWNPSANGGFHPAYFLAGINGKKISYASSIGMDCLTEAEVQEMQGYLRDFSHISVRELSSISLLDKLGYHAQCVLDPTLLLEKQDWQSFCQQEASGKPYLLVYYFGNAKAVMNTATKIAMARDLEIRRISVGFETYAADECVERFITPERFVALLLSASYVITNSFHGTVFSINFHKQFLSYPTTKLNPRFESVFRMFDLQSRNLRLLNDDEAVRARDIDYSDVDRKLRAMRGISKQYLNSALSDRGNLI